MCLYYFDLMNLRCDKRSRQYSHLKTVKEFKNQKCISILVNRVIIWGICFRRLLQIKSCNFWRLLVVATVFGCTPKTATIQKIVQLRGFLNFQFCRYHKSNQFVHSVYTVIIPGLSKKLHSGQRPGYTILLAGTVIYVKNQKLTCS